MTLFYYKTRFVTPRRNTLAIVKLKLVASVSRMSTHASHAIASDIDTFSVSKYPFAETNPHVSPPWPFYIHEVLRE